MLAVWDRIQGGLSELDAWIASEAAKRQADNRAAGVARNVAMVKGDTEGKYRQQIMERINRGFAPPEASAAEEILKSLGSQEGRDKVASQYAPDMRRGQGGWTGRGTMEMINQGIAENAIIRRGVLPTAIVGGGALGGVGMTAGAQQLMQLISYMQGTQETEERATQQLTS